MSAIYCTVWSFLSLLQAKTSNSRFHASNLPQLLCGLHMNDVKTYTVSRCIRDVYCGKSVPGSPSPSLLFVAVPGGSLGTRLLYVSV